MKKTGIALLLACAMFPAFAEQPAAATSDDPKVIVADQQRLQQEIAEGSRRVSGLSARDKREIADQQARVFALLNGKASLDELRNEERIETFNALQSINALVAKAAEERMVCRSERSTGSNLSRTNCRSVRQIREERESARRTMSEMNPRGTSGSN